jgi:UDP-glucose 4-epimerase
MKILVTGGAGFIGRHLVNRLISDKHEVVVLDSFYSSKKANLNKSAKVVEGDIRDASDVAKAIHGCSHVFHLAAISESRASDENLVYNVNFMGSKNVFEISEKVKAKVIFTSSAAVYGESRGAKETDATHPENQYGKSKLRGEKIVPPDSFIARLFNVYGPEGHGVVNKFAAAIPKYKGVTVFGHGSQTRDYVHVDDVIRALMLGLEKKGTYNVGTGREKSITDIIQIISDITRSTPDVTFAPAAPGDVQRSRADISKISKLWSPSMEIKEGIRNLLQHNGFDFSVLDKMK